MLLVFLFGLTAIHLWPAFHYNLGVDEAHYALFGLFPALSYFDHPPLVGWLQFLALKLGDSDFVLRLWALLLWPVANYLVYQISRFVYPDWSERQALLPLLLLNASALVLLVSKSVIPEVPLVVWTLAFVWLYLTRLNHDPQIRDWLLAGLLLGLAGLTKYTAILLPVTLALLMTLNQQWGQLKRPGPWLGALVGLAVISPVLIWNQANDWISFAYQLDHTTGADQWRPRRALQFQASQLISYGPALYLAGLWAVLIGCRQPRKASGQLAWFALIFLLFFAVSSAKGRALPHWTLTGWALAAPLATHWLLSAWQQGRIKRLFWQGMVALSLLLWLIGNVILYAPPVQQVPALKTALRDLTGWQMAAEQATELYQHHFSDAGEAGVLLVDNWTHASRIAWYARPLPVQLFSDRNQQFHLWYGSPSSDETQAILIRYDQNTAQAPIPDHRQPLDCTYLQTQHASHSGILVNRFHFYLCRP